MNGFRSGTGDSGILGPDLVGREAIKTRFPVRLPRLNGPRVERTPAAAAAVPGRLPPFRDERGTCAQRVRKTDWLERDPFQGPFQVHKRDELSLPGMEQLRRGVSFV